VREPEEAAGTAAATRQRLLDAGEVLFGERGFEGTSLRMVTEAAGSNVAGVNYHFGSKQGLFQAVVDRAMGPVNDERRQRLDAIEARNELASVADLVRAFVEPGLELTRRHGERGTAVARFIGRVICDPDPRIRQLFAAQVDPVEGRYLAALRRALPDLDDDTVNFAYTNMLGLLGLHQSGALATMLGPALPDNAPGEAATRIGERLIAFIAAGISNGAAGE
jgi:AcrR family transcriptional regulator